MTQLLLLRHAKSSWANPEMPDIERPLNKRGNRAARAMGQWLRANGLLPDRALVSAARRTRETWERLGLEAELELRPDLYEAEPDALLAALRGTSGQTVLMIGHNPGIGALARALAAAPPDHPRFADYPTAALTALRFPGPWSEIAPGTGEVTAFLTPHDLTDA